MGVGCKKFSTTILALFFLLVYLFAQHPNREVKQQGDREGLPYTSG